MYTSTLGSAYGNAQCPPWHPKSGSPTNCPPPGAQNGDHTHPNRRPGSRSRSPFAAEPASVLPPCLHGAAKRRRQGSKEWVTKAFDPDLKGGRKPTTVGRKPTVGIACRRSAYPRRRSVCTPRGRQRQTPHPAISGVKTRVSGALPLFPYGIRGFSRVAGPEYCWGRDATAARPHPLAKHQPNRVFRRKTVKERLKTRFGAK